MGYEWWLSGEWLSVSWVRGIHMPQKRILGEFCYFIIWNLVGGLEHEFYDFPYVGNFITPTDFHSFQRGWNHQPGIIGRYWEILFGNDMNFIKAIRIDSPFNEALRPPKTRIYSHRSNLQRLRFHDISLYLTILSLRLHHYSTRGSENGSNEASGSVQDKFHMWYFRHEKLKEP